MSEGHTASQFNTTSWTLIAKAKDNEADLDDLLRRYWSPVYAYLRRKGHQTADAADLTQAFLVEVMMEKDLIGKAEANRGKFRSFLISALNNFVIDEYRRKHGRDGKRAATFVPQDQYRFDAVVVKEQDDPAGAFDRQWATTVLSEALQRVENSCRETNLDNHWIVFEERLLQPVMNGCEPTPIEELKTLLGMKDPQEIYSMLQTMKRKVDRELRRIVEETVAQPADIDQELQDLRLHLVGD